MSSNILIIDCETTTSNVGNPFDLNNKLVCVGLKDTKNKDEIIYSYEKYCKYIQMRIDNSSLIVGFNIKFDLHWLRRIGIDISKIKIWDCQLAEFILNNQKTPYPSLNDAAIKYGFPPKIDNIKLNYWDKGIDTDMIPREELSVYLTQDLVLTQQVFEKQQEQFKNNKLFPLFRLQCADLLVLEEMEWNGIYFNVEKALKKAKELEKELDEIYKTIMGTIGDVPINLNSNDHISALLYGGNIVEDIRIPIGHFKSGEKVGQVRYKKISKVYEMPRLVEPIKGTETEKSKKRTLEEGVPPSLWEVNDTTLRRLKLNKESKKIIELLKRHSELEKLRGTYLEGYSKLIGEMNWEPNMLHGTLNQCVAVTGRLSSNKPNLQNADPMTKTFMETRYNA